MTTLGHTDLHDVLLVTQRALESRNVDEMKNRVLDCLEIIFKASKCAFVLADPHGEKLDYGTGIQRGFEPEFNKRYFAYYWRLDPHVQFLPHLPPVATIEEIVPLRDYLKSEIYNDLIKPQSIRYLMNIMLRSRGRLIGRLLLTRHAHTGNFTSRDKAKAQLMASHLNPILEEKMLLQHLENTNELLEFLVVAIPNGGIIILDEFFKPIHIDQAAKKNLALWFQTEWSQQGLEFNIPEEIHRACEILKTDACGDQDLGCLEHRLTIELGSSGQPLPVLLRMVKPHDKPVTFLICLNPEYHKMPFNRRLETLGLTPREQEVSHLVSEGLDNEQIADKLCISTLTLGTHLKSIYGKLGVNSRSSLIHRLFSFK